MRKVIFFCFLLLFFNGETYSYQSLFNADVDEVVINILSKHARKLREGESGDLRFFSSDKMRVYNRADGGTVESSWLRIAYNGTEWILDHEKGHISGSFDLICLPVFDNQFLSITIDGEKRIYPLPVIIKSKDIDLKFFIKDKIGRYSMDSSLAEYGRRPKQESEAVEALAQIISARSTLSKKRPAHRDYNFCDLTHCQVYRGRTNYKRTPIYKPDSSPWEIDQKKIKGGLFFHSRCGGTTFGRKVFGYSNNVGGGVKDKLYRTGEILCKTENFSWERSIGIVELLNILRLKNFGNKPEDLTLQYDKDNLAVKVYGENRTVSFPPETFRLMINRKRGWNFIKSNNYNITKKLKNGEGVLFFKGKGLGHGVGFCQFGALALAGKGYSRFEILKHYFPEMKFKLKKNKKVVTPLKAGSENIRLTHALTYSLFNLSSGEILWESNPSFMKRRLPPGSIWKIIVALYLAKERQDIFKDYFYTCRGKSFDDNAMPERCWKREGHGRLNMKSAISNSCNLYFASLYKKIKYNDFKNFYFDICSLLNIKKTLPEIKSEAQWSRLLAGLNFRFTLSTEDLVKIAGIVSPEQNRRSSIEKVKRMVPGVYRDQLYNALRETLITGTGKYPPSKKGYIINKFLYGRNRSLEKIISEYTDGMWGKTSTVIDGTNKPLSYGIFLGGYGHVGVISVLSEGNGHSAAQWGKILLKASEDIIK